MARDVIWTGPDGAGLEHLRLISDDEGLLADGMFVGRTDDLAPFRLHYLLRLSSAWELRAITLRLLAGETDGGREVSFTLDTTGTWLNAGDAPVPELGGCHEVDFQTSAFTKTLPIRRLALSPGESAEISVAYVEVPLMRVRPVRQRYTCIEAMGAEGGLYRYEPLFHGNTHELRVDPDGLVIDYPGVFTRAWSGESRAAPQPEPRGIHAT